MTDSSLEARARALVDSLGGRWTGRGGMVCCPAHSDRTPSLSIRVGDYGLLFHCFAGCDSRAVLRALRAIDGQAALSGPPMPSPDRTMRNAWLIALIKTLWTEAVPVAGTPAGIYLAGRGLAPPREGVRFHPCVPLRRNGVLGFRPAMLGAVREARSLVALQRSFLSPDGNGLARDLAEPRRMLGQPGRGLVRLARISGALGLAEGIETALSAMHMLGGPVWAVLGNERFARVDIPLGTNRLVLLADDDPAGRRAALAARTAHAAPGRVVNIRWPGGGFNDWNDRLRAEGEGAESRVRRAV